MSNSSKTYLEYLITIMELLATETNEVVVIESNVQTKSIPVLTRIKEKLIHYPPGKIFN